jgi:transposase
MAIVGGLDIHRRQITYDWIDIDTGQAGHGRIQPATRGRATCLARSVDWGQQADFAFEGTTGWWFVAEEVMDAGFRAHLAEPADTRALRGPSGAPRPTGPTPATCATCCCVERCPSRGSHQPTSPTSAPRCGCVRRSWTSAPAGISASTRSCTTTARPNAPGCSPSKAAPGWPASSCPPSPAKPWTWPCARSTSWTSSSGSWTPPWPASPAASRAARALMGRYGIGWLTAVSVWAEFGDVRRFANSRQAVRFARVPQFVVTRQPESGG